MPDLYETYIRTESGETYHPKDFREGLKQFLSEDGYRLSINIDGVKITLRRGSVSDTMRQLDDYLAQESVDCAVTIRGLRHDKPTDDPVLPAGETERSGP